MRVRILPLDDIAEFGKTDRVVMMLTIGANEAYEIQRALSGGSVGENLSAQKLYELMQAIASRDLFAREKAQNIFNTEGRYGLEVGK
jgi:hypothetical protein